MLLGKRDELDAQLAGEVAKLDSVTAQIDLAEYPIRPRKTDLTIQKVALAWVPTV